MGVLRHENNWLPGNLGGMKPWGWQKEILVCKGVYAFFGLNFANFFVIFWTNLVRFGKKKFQIIGVFH